MSGDDDHDRACQAIPAFECTAIPRNYLLNVLNGAAAKLAEQVASAKVALPWFRRFLLVRLALLSVELAGPFYVVYARDMFAGQAGMLGTIVIAAGAAAALSSPFWGRFADWSSPKVLFLSGLLGASAGIVALAIGLLPSAARSLYLMAGMFVLFGIAEAGVMLGRKTDLIDRVDAGHRATYVAFANSAMGVAALLFGGLGMVAEVAGLKWLISLLLALSIAGGVLSLWLPGVSGDSEATQTTRSTRALGTPAR